MLTAKYYEKNALMEKTIRDSELSVLAEQLKEVCTGNLARG